MSVFSGQTFVSCCAWVFSNGSPTCPWLSVLRKPPFWMQHPWRVSIRTCSKCWAWIWLYLHSCFHPIGMKGNRCTEGRLRLEAPALAKDHPNAHPDFITVGLSPAKPPLQGPAGTPPSWLQGSLRLCQAETLLSACSPRRRVSNGVVYWLQIAPITPQCRSIPGNPVGPADSWK